jgi:hypothetical protein
VSRDVAGKTGQGKIHKKRARVHKSARIVRKDARTKGVRGTVLEERLFRPDGHSERVLTLDANSATFASDLTLVFEKNVARARREHKKMLSAGGRADQGG